MCVAVMIACGLSSIPDVSAAQYALHLNTDTFEQGQDVFFNLVFIQLSPSEPATFPDAIDCELIVTGKDRLHVQARPTEKDHSVSSTLKSPLSTRGYSFTLPEDLSGEVLVRMADVPVPAFLVYSTVAEPSQAQEEENYQYADSLFDLYQPYLKNISAYEPMYFLVGTDPRKSKFQISFKYRFINSGSPLVSNHPWLAGFHLGYTQISFWDLESDSTPFTDTSYKPEIFWESRNFLSEPGSTLQGIFLRTGTQHHSNGKDGDSSRSTNYLYARPSVFFYDRESTLGIEIATKFWAYAGNDGETNSDLEDYLGYFEIETKAGFAESIVLSAKYGWASEGHSAQFDLSYPVHKFFNNALELYLHVQYSNMLAESLLNYQERTEALRVGISIVR